MEIDNVAFNSSIAQERMSVAYTDLANYIHSTTGKAVMVAPYFIENDRNGLTPSKYASMWGKILVSAPIDVIALQDGIGAGNSSIRTVAQWFSAMRTSIKKTRPTTQFWSDLETMTTNYTPASVSRVLQQLAVEKPYVDKFTTFSFNHYDSPQQGYTSNYNAWKRYSDTH
jgi:hypothetical protein